MICPDLRECCELVEPRIGHRHFADIRLDGAERIVRRLRRRRCGQRIEQRRLADIRQSDNSTFESHDVSEFLREDQSGRSASLGLRVVEALGLHREMNLVLKTRILALRDQIGIVRDDVAQRRHPVLLALGEIVEHVGMDQILVTRVTDTDAHPPILIADMRADRTQAVVTCDAAADLDPHLGRRQVDFVVKHDDVVDAELVEIRRFRDRASGFVHERAGQQQKRLLAADRALGRDALKALAATAEVHGGGQLRPTAMNPML